MPNEPMLFFTFLVREACREGVSLNQLANAINGANAGPNGSSIVNRRLLKKLHDGSRKLGLTVDQYAALDRYFRVVGKITGEPPMFAHELVIETLVRVPRVHFIYAAKPRTKEQRVDVSCWDLDAGAQVLTAASRASAKCEFATEHVLFHTPATLPSVQGETWFRVLDQDQDSVVSIGSPLASLSTEVMLARMFGVTPFQTPDPGAARALPFWYCWAPVIAGRFHSAFALTPDGLATFHAGIAARVRANQSHAFGFEGQVHEVPRTGDAWTMHGIIAAQRRPAGNVWLVISGLAGPATCAAAKLVPAFKGYLSWQPHQTSAALWIPVRAQVKQGAASPARGDLRELERQTFLGEPRQHP